MTEIEWRSVASVAPDKLGEARHQVHSAVQWLARMARSYREPEPEGRNMALLWRPDRSAIVTQELANDLGMQLTLPQLVMQFTERDQPVRHDFETEGHSPAHVEAWILVELLHRGIDRERFSKALPYDVSRLMAGDAVEFSPETCEAELGALSAWYANAAAVLTRAGRRVAGSEGEAPQLRIWPQDLCLERLLPLAGSSTVEDRAIRIGFSPGNETVPEPFFYVARQERDEGRGRQPEAVLKASDLPSGEGAAARALGFFEDAIAAARKGAAQ